MSTSDISYNDSDPFLHFFFSEVSSEAREVISEIQENEHSDLKEFIIKELDAFVEDLELLKNKKVSKKDFKHLKDFHKKNFKELKSIEAITEMQTKSTSNLMKLSFKVDAFFEACDHLKEIEDGKYVLKNNTLKKSFINALKNNSEEAIDLLNVEFENCNYNFIIELVIHAQYDLKLQDLLVSQIFKNKFHSEKSFIKLLLISHAESKWIFEKIEKNTNQDNFQYLDFFINLFYNTDKVEYIKYILELSINKIDQKAFLKKVLICLVFDVRTSQTISIYLDNILSEKQLQSDYEFRAAPLLMNLEDSIYNANIGMSQVSVSEIPPHLLCFAKIMHLDRLIRLQEFLKSSFKYTESRPVVSKCFPKAKTIVVGDEDQANINVANKIQKFVKQTSLQVAATVKTKSETAQAMQNVTLLESDVGPEKWLQDIFFPCDKEGDYSVMLPTLATSRQISEDELTKSSRSRLALYDMESTPLRIDSHNRLYRFFDQITMYSFLRQILPFDRISSSLSFVEGGNYLSGSLNGKPCLIVGYDSLEASEMTITDDLQEMGYQKDPTTNKIVHTNNEGTIKPTFGLFKREVAKCIAQDFSIPPERVFFVTQPHSFHIDMKMNFLGNGTVILNDQLQAAQMMFEHLARQRPDSSLSEEEEEILADYIETARMASEIEDATASELENFGFKVIRYGGTSYNPLPIDTTQNRFNYFNFVSMTIDNKKYILALSYNNEFDEKFDNFIKENLPGDKVTIFHLDEKTSRELLSKDGGIACYSKVLTFIIDKNKESEA